MIHYNLNANQKDTEYPFTSVPLANTATHTGAFFGSAFIKEYKAVEISWVEYMCFKYIISEIRKIPLRLTLDLRQGAQDGTLSHMLQAVRINTKSVWQQTTADWELDHL